MSLLKLILLVSLLILLNACQHQTEVGDGGIVVDDAPAPATVILASDVDSVSLEEVVVTARKSARRSSSKTSIPIEEPTHETSKRTTEIQSGTITAADYDDQLNRQLFLDYASKFLQTNPAVKLPFLDLNQSISFSIKDANGKAASGVTVKVMADNKLLKNLTTPANGVVILYPTYDKLPESFELKILDNNSKLLSRKKVTLANLKNNSSQAINFSKSLNPKTQLDLALVIDTTGSMGDELEYLKKELRAIVTNITEENDNLNIKVGLVLYRDTSDAYVTREFDFTNVDKATEILAKQNYGGGGDFPEAMDQALASANALTWRPNSTKIMLLVADAPPHDDKIQETWKQAETARSKQIHILPIAASGVGDKAQYLMRSMAALTQSRYIFLTDDSGVGNKHAEPSVDCYVVTRLDNLITRIVNGLILGMRIEAKDQDIIRRKGSFQNGLCAATEPSKLIKGGRAL